MRRRNRDAPRFFLRRLVDLVKRHVLRQPLLRQYLRDRRRQRRLAMIHMPDRPYVDMRLRPRKFRLRHPRVPSLTTLKQFTLYSALCTALMPAHQLLTALAACPPFYHVLCSNPKAERKAHDRT